MNRICLVIIFCIITEILFAQKLIDSIAIREDFNVFEKILKKGHPALYDYIDQDSLDYMFESTKESLAFASSDIDFYKKILTISSKIKDGNLQVLFPNTVGTDQYYFPLITKIINRQLYTDTDDFDIPIGSRINLINDRKISTVLEKLKKYVPTYGNNSSRKYREIELKFGLYFAYEFGIHKKFIIQYTTPDGIDTTKVIPAESFVKATRRNTNRNSYFANFHDQQNGFSYYSSFISGNSPFVYYKKELNTAVLVVNSFNGDTRVFKSNLTRIFKEIKKKKVRHLVIDIRRNNNGFRANAIQLYSFIATNIFKQRISEYVATINIPEKKHLVRTFYNEKQFLKDKFNYHPIYDGWKITFDDMETIMVPDKHRFKGNIYVLISGTTFSAASTFALNVKNDTTATLVGEETGGGYYFSTGEFPVYYELPNTKIGLMMYLEKINHYIKDTTIAKGSGVPPDKHILLTTEDLINGTDPELDYIFRLIKG